MSIHTQPEKETALNVSARILIVEDEPSVRLLLEKILTKDGYQVISVESGEEALTQIATQAIDLAMIDLKLKGIGGLQVLAALRRHAPDTAAIVVTAYGSLETAIEALRQGAHDYLLKPYAVEQLRESVRTALLKRQRKVRREEAIARLEQNLLGSLEEIHASTTGQTIQPPATIEPSVRQTRFLQRGKLTIDFMRRVIVLDGHILALTPTEFNLLAYLVAEAPRIVSPQELVRQVQGYESDAWEAHNIVRSHIYNIRRKIKNTTGHTDVIRTARGAGYAIDKEKA